MARALEVGERSMGVTRWKLNAYIVAFLGDNALYIPENASEAKVQCVDKLDHKILATLQSHPDMSTSDVADRVGLSNTPCWRRIKKLEADGVITGRAILLDAKALDLTVNVFADIRLKQHDEETLLALEAAVVSRPEIVECFSVSGESDYMVRIVTRNIEAYEAFLKKVLLHLPGVAAVNSRFALGCVKMTTALPI